MSNALSISGFKMRKAVVLSFIICLLYAISDEVHQTLIPGRSGEVSDVILDTIGASIGILIYFQVRKFALLK